MQKKILFHLGYPKTASTWLQRNLFNNEDKGFSSPEGPHATRALESFALHSGYRFEETKARKQLLSLISHDTDTKATVHVFSHEDLIGNQFGEKYWGYEMSERLAKSFPEAYILLCIREQRDMVLSSYAQYIKQTGCESLRGFIGSGKLRPGVRPVCMPEFLEYDRAVEHLYGLFGQSRVFVLPYELLKSDPSEFVRRLCLYLEIEPIDPPHAGRANRANGGFSLRVERILNRFCGPRWKEYRPGIRTRVKRKCIVALDRVLPAGIQRRESGRLVEEINDTLGARYAQSNSRLSTLIDENLAQYGYPVED